MTQPAAPARSDRRIVTIMFADISGFTAMSERMDAEQVTGIMNECFERLAVVIGKYEGTIDKYIGDCVMVLFGAPIAMEDAPQRALNAAIGMREELERYTQERKLASPLSLHIGVNTGEVIYGAVGSMEQRRDTVMGDAVNLASRLEDASTAGQILVGPETYRRTGSQFDFLSVGPLQLKGKAEKVSVYELRSRKPSVGRARAEAGRVISSAMVGRERELDRLELQVLKAINGEGSIIHVIGEAGIGKSRLMAEVRERVARKRVMLLEGRAISSGQNLGYHMFDDLLRHWCGIAEDDAPAESMRKLERLLVDIVGGEAEEILPLVALLTGMKLSGSRQERVNGIEPQSLPVMVAGRFRQLLTAAARRSAVILVLEDLHWADQSSVELLESLFRLVESHPVMVVTVSRPGYEDTSARIRGFTSSTYPDRTVELHLEALTEAECTTLLQGLTKMADFPKPLRDQIHARAGGNPFFVEEIIRSLLSSGSLEVVDGALHPANEAGAVTIPSTVNEVIMSRFDRLEEGLKVLRVAAVIGRSFFRTILLQLVEHSQGLEQGIEQLKGLQMVRERKRQLEVEYVFTHAIVQETFYASLLQQRRKELHGKVAKAIEARFADRLQEFYGLLAYHYGHSDEEGKVEEYLALAGEEALKTAASSEATVFLTQALEMYLRSKGEAIDRRRAAGLVNGIAMAYAARGEYEEAIRHFRLAESYMGVRPERTGVRVIPVLVEAVLRLLAVLYLPSGERRKPASADELFIIDIEHCKCRMLLMSKSSVLLVASLVMTRRVLRHDVATIPNAPRLFFDIGGLLDFVGFFGMAQRAIEHASRHMRETEIRDQYALQYSRLNHGELSGDRPFTYNRDIRHAMVKAADFFTYQLFMYESGFARDRFRDLAYVEALIEEALRLAEENNHRQIRAMAIDISLYLKLKRRLLTEVVNEYRRYQDIIRASADEFESVAVRSWVAEAEILQGNLDEAARMLGAESEILRRSGYLPATYLADHAAAGLHLAVARIEEAAASPSRPSRDTHRRECRWHGVHAVRLSRKYARIRAEVYRHMGTWLWLDRRPRNAFRWWEKSIDEAERLGYRLELARTHFEIGCRLHSASPKHRILRGLGSDGYLAKAETLFREIGLEKDLVLLRDFRAQSA
jgi:class 3 adenylate cyclase/ABC-type cobalamin transport system ATPase subunit